MDLFSLESHFYHGSVRRYVSLFGSLFSNLHIKRTSEDGKREDFIKVPIRYGNGNMYLKAPQDASREINQISRVLPAMSFQMDNIYKDIERKTNPLNRIQNTTYQQGTGSQNKLYQMNRIPYNFIFELVIMTKNSDDMMQIVEQIIPAFDGNLSVTVSDTTGVAVEQDIIIVLQEVTMEDNFDSEMQSRLIEWKITFELKGFLYKKTQSGLIVREVDIMSGKNFDDMFLLETLVNQTPIQETQVNTSKLTDLIGTLPSLPKKRITRKDKVK